MKAGSKKTIARILLGLVALFMLANGLQIMFAPELAIEGLLVSADGPEALSNVRALWGGAITAIGISVVFAAVTGEIINARPAVLFTFALIIARTAGLVIDGTFDRAILYIVVPIIVFLILLTAHKLLDQAAASETA